MRTVNRWFSNCTWAGTAILFTVIAIGMICADAVIGIENSENLGAKRVSLVQSDVAPPATSRTRTMRVEAAANQRIDEHAVDELVRNYLPELRPVLSALRTHSANEYEKAITDLSRTSRRLQAIHGRDIERYGMEVAFVQWQTRSDLALAKLQLRDTTARREDLKHALHQRETLRLQRIKYDRDRLQQRQERITAQIQRLDQQIHNTHVEQAVAKAFALALRKHARGTSAGVRKGRKTSKTSESKQDLGK